MKDRIPITAAITTLPESYCKLSLVSLRPVFTIDAICISQFLSTIMLNLLSLLNLQNERSGIIAKQKMIQMYE